MKYGRAVIIIESTDENQLLAFIQTMFVEWKKLLHLTEEPMTNVLCSYQENIWRLIIFPAASIDRTSISKKAMIVCLSVRP